MNYDKLCIESNNREKNYIEEENSKLLSKEIEHHKNYLNDNNKNYLNQLEI